MLKLFSFLLWPFAVLYQLLTHIRNWAFDRGVLKSYHSKIPSIIIGNLSVGGTGKTPMIEFLLRLKLTKKPAVISRGYGRSSKGLLMVDPEGNSQQYGDESLQIAKKFPQAKLWVSEKRALGAKAAEAANCDLILYDDAFQHRYVKGDFQIMLSSYHDPFYEDWILPMGRLREARQGAERADAIIITKCPDLSEGEKAEIKRQCKGYSKADVYFARLSYEACCNRFGESLNKEAIEVITGIARVEPMLMELEKDHVILKHWAFSDHHNFSREDLDSIWAKDPTDEKTWVCSEKDYVKLSLLFEAAGKLKRLYYLPVAHQFSDQDAAALKRQVEGKISAQKD